METPQITLTLDQTWALNHALQLDEGGWVAAANWLRRRHFPDLPWNDPKVQAQVSTHRGFEMLFHLHHGSLPPFTPTPSRPPVPSLPSAIPTNG